MRVLRFRGFGAQNAALLWCISLEETFVLFHWNRCLWHPCRLRGHPEGDPDNSKVQFGGELCCYLEHREWIFLVVWIHIFKVYSFEDELLERMCASKVVSLRSSAFLFMAATYRHLSIVGFMSAELSTPLVLKQASWVSHSPFLFPSIWNITLPSTALTHLACALKSNKILSPKNTLARLISVKNREVCQRIVKNVIMSV